MIRSDSHVHTSFSSDSDTPMEAMLCRAGRLHLDSVCFTEHMDYDFPKLPESPYDFVFDVPSYLDTIAALRRKFPAATIRQGIELGLKPYLGKRYQELLDKYPFDFVIGSTHLVHDMDPYYPSYWEGCSEETGIMDYYETTLDNILAGIDFDVYGHIDYILRYTPSLKRLRQENADTNPYLEKCLSLTDEIIDEILRQLILRGKGIELNTAGFKYGLGHAHPHEFILKRYRELGGEILTVGSDAHQPGHLCCDFRKVPAILQECGFSHYTVFESRTPRWIKL